jgi:EmrB/QacA subfamily drug resistance transporter
LLQQWKQTFSNRKTRRGFVLAAVVIGMFMSAIEGTIVSTAMPSIVAELGGFTYFSWVFSSYLLMQAITIPIYGKLADLYGRKPIYISGIVIFLLGSILCGFATSMPLLVAFRFIQGIGAGAVQPIATTIVGDIYSMEERGKIQGYLSSVWGISSIAGPLVGGLFVEYIHWSWVFWVNIPFGILSLIGMVLFLHEGIEKNKHTIDYIGSGLLFVSISALMLFFIQGGVAWNWSSPPSVFLLFLFIVTILLFLIQEKRAINPMMPLDLWKNKIISLSNIGALTTGMLMIGASSYIPTYVQGVLGESPFVAGLSLGAMSIGWPISSTIAGNILPKLGTYKTALIGGFGLLIGTILLMLTNPNSGALWVSCATFFIGVGMGFTSTTFIVSIQSTVEWNVRGVATASNMFMRILGNTIGVAIMGSILNSRLLHYLKTKEDELGTVNLDITNLLLDLEERNSLTNSTLSILESGLNISLHYVFASLIVLGIISFILICYLPKKEKKT